MAELLDDGFDSVDLVVFIEEIFDISIPDKDAEKLRNVGECEDYIIEKLKEKGIDLESEEVAIHCATQCAFYQIRNGLAKVLNTDPKKMHPNDLTENYFPKKQRRQLLKKIRKELGWYTSVLVWPWHFPCTIIIGIVVLFLIKKFLGEQIAAVGFILFIVLIGSIAVPLCREFTTECKTLGGFSKRIFRWNFNMTALLCS